MNLEKTGNQHPRWIQNKEKSSFKLHITKKVTGLTTMRLSDSFVKWLANTILPSVITATLKQNLSTKLGPYLYKRNNFFVEGAFQVVGDMSPHVWRAPLVGATMAARAARKALGVNEEEALLLDQLCRGPRATAAGFHQKVKKNCFFFFFFFFCIL